MDEKYTSLPEIIKENHGAIAYVRDNEEEFGHYRYNNYMVPRVSRILDAAIGNKGLVDWAGRVGYSKMTQIRDSALKVGTIVHEMIEYFLLHQADKKNMNFSDYDMTNNEMMQTVRSYKNFKAWFDHVVWDNKVEILGTEVEVSCPWYGGTIDCIMRINGATYIVDFKTSKQLSTNYLYQTCAYAWIVNNGYCSVCDHVDGVGLLRFDKTYENKFEEYFLTNSNPMHSQQLFQYTRTFWAIVNSYYNLVYSGYIFNSSDYSQYLIGENNE